MSAAGRRTWDYKNRGCKETRIIMQRMHRSLASLYEGGDPKGRRECPTNKKTLPQSKTGSEEPVFASPLKEGAKGICISFG